ncbi:MAG TPA: DUF1080 domain-containing protein [Bryobacteraceae bacterium]|nr:DUF1080 domain-containing protein [Bryobacteraceae bacterium]
MRTLGLLVLSAAAALAAEGDIRLFNGKDLDGFYTYLRSHGKNQDPDRVFRVEKGQIHVSGAEYGYLCTEREFGDYYLSAEFRWGDATWAPRETKARDSGILFHVGGDDKVWPRSIEFQMIEGGTGDIIVVDGTSLTVKGETRDKGRFDRFGKGPWQDVIGYRDPNGEVEKPRGKWNRMEMWVEGDKVRMHLNGKLVNEGTGASVTKGKILFQSEGAEVWFRNIVLRPLRPTP